MAEYAAPVWARSSYAQKLNPELNSACRAVTGCLKPTNVEDLYGWNCATRHPERCMCSSGKDQTGNQRGSLSIWIRCTAWLRRLQAIPHRATVNLDESLAKGFDRPWTTWRCLHRLRTGFTCCKEQRQRWQYYEGDTTCECGLAKENTAHMMQCTLLAQPCSLDDLNKFYDSAKKCVEGWKTLV